MIKCGIAHRCYDRDIVFILMVCLVKSAGQRDACSHIEYGIDRLEIDAERVASYVARVDRLGQGLPDSVKGRPLGAPGTKCWPANRNSQLSDAFFEFGNRPLGRMCQIAIFQKIRHQIVNNFRYQLSLQRNMTALRHALETVLERPVKVEIVLLSGVAEAKMPSDHMPGAGKDEEPGQEPAEGQGKKRADQRTVRDWMKDEAVRKVIETFDGEIIDVRD